MRSQDSNGETHPVGQKKPNDWYGENYYLESPAIDPGGPDYSTNRIARGSDFVNPAKRACRSSLRVGTRSPLGEDKGFRLVILIK